MNDIINYQGGQVPADPQAIADYYKQTAEAYAEQERRAGSSISVRNGIMAVGDSPIPHNQFAAVILDAVRMNTFYREAFNASNITPPTCYAISRDESNLAPHPDMAKDLNWFQPQSERCGGCPHNEFGSGRTGTGKACSNRRRLLLLVAGVYEQGPTGLQLNPYLDPTYYATAPMLSLALAPTTLGGWGEFVRKTAADYQRPVFGVISRVYLYQHPKHGKEAIGFEALAPTPDNWAPTIIGRHQEAAREIMEGFEPPQQQTQRGGGFYQAQNQVTSG